MSVAPLNNFSLYSPSKFVFNILHPPFIQNEVFTFHIKNIGSPGVSFGSRSYSDGHIKYNIPGTNPQFDESFTIDFLVDEDLKNWKMLYNWGIRNTKPRKGEKQIMCGANIAYLTNSLQHNVVQNFEYVFPHSLSGYRLDYSDTQRPFLIATCTFRYTLFYFDCEEVP